MTALGVAAIIDAAAQIFSGAIPGSNIFAAGVTTSVTDATPLVVPLSDDFTEAGMPAVTVALVNWEPILQPGNERMKLMIRGVVWRPRLPLSNHAALYDDMGAILDAWLAHSKGGTVGIAEGVQSAIITGGPGIVPRAIPHGSGERMYLTMPIEIEVMTARPVLPQPA